MAKGSVRPSRDNAHTPQRRGDPFDSYSLNSLHALTMTMNDLEADYLETRDAEHAFWLRLALADAIQSRYEGRGR